MEDSKSMKERSESLSTDEHLAMPMEDKRMTENSGISPEINGDIAHNVQILVMFQEIIKRWRQDLKA